MANIDKIKEQGNQAAPLLTELCDEKLVISCTRISGNPGIESLEINGLKGKTDFMKFRDLIRTGKLDYKRVEVLLVEESTKYKRVHKAYSVYYSSEVAGRLDFYTHFIVHNPASNAVDIFLTIGMEDFDVKIYAYNASDLATKYNITAEFAD